ncbi:MAG: aminoacyl-tRNA hydrolase [Bacillota bacterium]
MKLIVGLGNPGFKYSKTRHNVGFQVVNRLANIYEYSSSQKCDAIIGEGTIMNKKVILAQPLTYMNKSGIAVKCLVKKFNLDLNDILIIYDDLNLEVGKIRLRTSGSSGGHNGMKSIIRQLSSSDFSRLRIGIGKPEYGLDVANYVLSKFKPEEKEIIDKTIDITVKAVESFVKFGPEETMNKFN